MYLILQQPTRWLWFNGFLTIYYLGNIINCLLLGIWVSTFFRIITTILMSIFFFNMNLLMNLELFSQKVSENRISESNILRPFLYLLSKLSLWHFNQFIFTTKTELWNQFKTENPEILARTAEQTYNVATRGQPYPSTAKISLVRKVVYELAALSQVVTSLKCILFLKYGIHLFPLETRIIQRIYFTLSPENVHVGVRAASLLQRKRIVYMAFWYRKRPREQLMLQDNEALFLLSNVELHCFCSCFPISLFIYPTKIQWVLSMCQYLC